MYTAIGAFIAKSKLSELLRHVSQGQRYTILLRGHPVADLVPTESAMRGDVRAAVESMRGFRKIQGISPDTLADWTTEGRK